MIELIRTVGDDTDVDFKVIQTEFFGSFQHPQINLVLEGLIQDVFVCIQHDIQPCLVVENTDAALHQTNFWPQPLVALRDGYTFELSCFEATKFRIHLLPHTEVMQCR